MRIGKSDWLLQDWFLVLFIIGWEVVTMCRSIRVSCKAKPKQLCKVTLDTKSVKERRNVGHSRMKKKINILLRRSEWNKAHPQKAMPPESCTKVKHSSVLSFIRSFSHTFYVKSKFFYYLWGRKRRSRKFQKWYSTPI